jgi:hypothetical protein
MLKVDLPFNEYAVMVVLDMSPPAYQNMARETHFC